MHQYEAVIQVMKEKGGFATLGYLYDQALRVPGVTWKTRTPFASIRRIVQDERYFYKIRPGLWALNEYRGKLPFNETQINETSDTSNGEFNHSYYQGLIVEIGNLYNFNTIVPAQDKNKTFLDRPLKEITTMTEIFQFGYAHLVSTCSRIDVSWFNSRNMPEAFVEIEHSTDFSESFLKFMELQDFRANYWIVAPKVRENQFIKKLSFTAFNPIRDRVKFLNYERVSQLHSNLMQTKIEESGLFNK